MQHDHSNLKSGALLYSGDPIVCTAVRRVLEPHGWRVCTICDAVEALGHLNEVVAVVVIDTSARAAARLISEIRAQPQPPASVPILQWGGERLSGASALLPMDDTDLKITIEHFTGALPDHALRQPPYSPFYRLVRLLGTQNAAAMLARFADSLRAALAETVATPDQAHRLAGLAGALGYGDLALAWRTAEHGGAEAIANAVAESEVTLAEIEHGEVARYAR